MSTRRFDLRATVPVEPFFETVTQEALYPVDLSTGADSFTLSPLEVGVRYTFRTRLTASEAGAYYLFSMDVTPVAEGLFAYVEDLEFTWVATATSVMLQIFTDPGVSIPGTIVMTRPVERHEMPLRVKGAQISLDESWAPYAQVTLDCVPPPAGDALDLLDPRAGRRVRVSLGTYFGSSWPITRLTADFGGDSASLTAWLAGRGIRAFADTFSEPYNATGQRPSQVRTMDLMMRSRRRVDTIDDGTPTATLTVTATSDEAALQDAALVATAPVSPVGTDLSDVASLALARIGAALDETHDVAGLDADSLAWEPGVSAWDYISPLVLASDRRLWCDEQRAWRLDDPMQTIEGGVRINGMLKAISEEVDRDSDDWCEAVVVEYRWTDGAGAEHVRYDTAGHETASKVRTIRWARPYVRTGAAAAILRVLQGRGRTVTVEAVADFRVSPGQPTLIALVDGRLFTATVSRVDFQMPEGVMTVKVRDASEVIEGTYGHIPPDVTYDDIPDGMSWEDYMTSLTAEV